MGREPWKSAPNRFGWKWVKWGMRVFIGLAFVWCVLALWFDFPGLGLFLAPLFGLGVARRAVTSSTERQRLAWIALPCATVIVWWVMIPPRNDRPWNLTGKTLAVPERDGDRVLIRNLRNFRHLDKKHSEPGYYDATFDLNDLESVDLIFDHFLGEGPVSHTMLSFGFKNDRYLCLTIEARREEGEPYSILWAFFKGYEIIYYLGDERDILYQCTNILEQETHLFRLNLSPKEKRLLLENVLNKAARLVHHPEWYHFLTNNCTNNLLWLSQSQTIEWHEPGIVLNGYAARLLYRHGYLADQIPFAELKSRSQIKKKALAAGYCPDFSKKIREGLVIPSRPLNRQ